MTHHLFETYRPHAGQQAFHDSDARFKVLIAGARFGKSLAAARDDQIGNGQPDQNLGAAKEPDQPRVTGEAGKEQLGRCNPHQQCHTALHCLFAQCQPQQAKSCQPGEHQPNVRIYQGDRQPRSGDQEGHRDNYCEHGAKERR